MKTSIKKWKHFKHYIRSNPNLIDSTYRLNMTDAQNMIDNGSPMTFQEMIRAAMQKSTIPTREWEKSVRALGKRSKKVRCSKRWVIAVASLLVMILFFTATPVGRVWAKSAIQLVVQIFEDKIVVENSEDVSIDSVDIHEKTKTGVVSGNYDVQHFLSIEDFCLGTNLNPVVITDSDVQIEEVVYQPESADGKLVTIVYTSNKWGSIVTNQVWSSGEGFISGFQKEHYITKVMNNDYEMYCCVNPDDNLFEGIVVFDDLIFTIGLKNQENISDLLKTIEFYH